MFSDATNGNLEGWRDTALDLSSHVAVVTGAARGIGRATCIELARQGAKAIAAVDMSAELADFAAQANQKLGRDVFVAFQGDVTSSIFRKQVFSTMRDKHGPISICVPAAGITRDRLSVKMNRDTGAAELYPEEDFRRVMEIDLTAPIYWALETIASVAQQRQHKGLKRWTPSEGVAGCVVFIGSVSSAGNRGQISYATAKAGLEGAAATLASEAIYHGVRSAIIHPGYTDTAMVRTLGEEFIRDNILPHTQLGRLIYPEEIARTIVFMVRNAAVSGEIWADAGWHPGT